MDGAAMQVDPLTLLTGSHPRLRAALHAHMAAVAEQQEAVRLQVQVLMAEPGAEIS